MSLKFYSSNILLLLTLLSSLTPTSLCKFHLLPKVICLQSALKLNVLGLLVLTLHWTYLQTAVSPGESNKPSLPNKGQINLETLLYSTAGTAQDRHLLCADLHFLEMEEELPEKKQLLRVFWSALCEMTSARAQPAGAEHSVCENVHRNSEHLQTDAFH